QLLAPSRVPAQGIIPRDPALRPRRPPQGEPLPTLGLSRLLRHVRRAVACSASWRVAWPLPRQGHAEVEHGMGRVRDVAHHHTAWAVVALAPVAAPWALPTHRRRAALGKTAGINGAEGLGLAPALGPLANHHGEHRALSPREGADAVWEAWSLHSDARRPGLSIVAGPGRQQPVEVEVPVALAGLGLPRVWVGPHARAE